MFDILRIMEDLFLAENILCDRFTVVIVKDWMIGIFANQFVNDGLTEQTKVALCRIAVLPAGPGSNVTSITTVSKVSKYLSEHFHEKMNIKYEYFSRKSILGKGLNMTRHIFRLPSNDYLLIEGEVCTRKYLPEAFVQTEQRRSEDCAKKPKEIFFRSHRTK